MYTLTWLLSLACIVCSICNGMNYTLEGGISCGGSRNGTIMNYNGSDIIYLYYFYAAYDYDSIIISTCDSDFDTELYFFNISLSLIDSCDDCGSCGTNEQLTVYDVSSGWYFIGISGFGGGSGNYSLDVFNCTYGSTTGGGYTTTSYSSDTTNYTYKGEIDCGEQRNGSIGSNDIGLYGFSVTELYPVIQISTCGSSIDDTVLYLYNISGGLIGECDDCGDCGYQSIGTLRYLSTGYYFIGVGGYDSYEYGDYVLNIICGNNTMYKTSTSMPYYYNTTTGNSSGNTYGYTSTNANSTFMCNTGCSIPSYYYNDYWCDCPNCDDEPYFNCTSCYYGCSNITRTSGSCASGKRCYPYGYGSTNATNTTMMNSQTSGSETMSTMSTQEDDTTTSGSLKTLNIWNNGGSGYGIILTTIFIIFKTF